MDDYRINLREDAFRIPLQRNIWMAVTTSSKSDIKINLRKRNADALKINGHSAPSYYPPIVTNPITIQYYFRCMMIRIGYSLDISEFP